MDWVVDLATLGLSCPAPADNPRDREDPGAGDLEERPPRVSTAGPGRGHVPLGVVSGTVVELS